MPATDERNRRLCRGEEENTAKNKNQQAQNTQHVVRECHVVREWAPKGQHLKNIGTTAASLGGRVTRACLRQPSPWKDLFTDWMQTADM